MSGKMNERPTERPAVIESFPQACGDECVPCSDGEHADDGTGQDCPCCGQFVSDNTH